MQGNPKAAKPINKKPAPKANEQLALPELLFDLECSDDITHALDVHQCLGVGPNRACNRSLEVSIP